jgi:outer membrane protein assembly factor BamD
MKKIVLLATVLLASACASDKVEGDLTGSVGKLYNDGMDYLQAGRYPQAVHTFEELDRQYPYSGWAAKAQLNTAYAQFLDKNYEETVVAAERFIRLHPGHKDAPYALYLVGLSHYGRMSDVNRDQSATADALGAFLELTERFPDSEYARDAKLKITLCKDHLAGKEMTVGRYYQDQKQYLAAINRFKAVLAEFETSSHTPEALYRLTESYLALGVNEEAKRSAAILGYNHPGSPWYKKAYALLKEKQLAPAGESESWAKNISKGLKKLF